MTDTTNTTGATDERTSPLSNLSSAARDAQAQLAQRASQAREWATSQTDVARQTVVERPFVSTGAAFAAGVIFGILLARR